MLQAELILNEPTTQIGELCSLSLANRDAYLLGVVSPDLTVIFYYEEGGKEYRLSHNWNFQQEITAEAKTADEQCFAYGIAAHLIQDGVSHTGAIPKAIEKFRIPNWILHPLLEKKYDSALVLKYPKLITSTPQMMYALDGPKGDRYVEMIDNAMGENSAIDVKNELKKLQLAISGGEFYDIQFRPSGAVWIFQSYIYIDKLTNWLSPYIGTMNFGDIDFYYEKSKEQTVNVFNNWGTRYQVSPHGFNELTKANEKAGNSLTILFILAFGIPAVIAYMKRRKKYLLLIPLILIAIIVGVYAML